MNKLGLCMTGTLVAAASLAIGCSSSSSGATTGEDGGSAGSAPTIAITGLTSGESVTVTTEEEAGTVIMKTIPIPFELTNFTLMAPGTCPGGASNKSCGHIHVLVDGATCTPAGSPYDNADATGSPAIAILNTCPTVNGPHTVSLELHNDVHAALVPPVSTSVMITATGG